MPTRIVRATKGIETTYDEADLQLGSPKNSDGKLSPRRRGLITSRILKAPVAEAAAESRDAALQGGTFGLTRLAHSFALVIFRLTGGVSRSGAHDTQRRCRLHAEVSHGQERARMAD